MSKSKLSAFLTLLLVFASGAVLGAVAHRLYVVNTVLSLNGTTKRPSPEEFRKRQVNEMRDRVKLDDAQLALFNQILDQTKASFDQTHKQYNAANRAIWDEQRNRVRAALRPDQVVLFDQLMAEHDAARKQREHDRDKK
jgi:Mg2+ and Co2+ transporter CorA